MTRTDLRRLCDGAIAAFRAGNLADAEDAALRILALDPIQFEANHILGIVRAKQMRSAEALDLLDTALKSNPHAAEAWRHHGNVLMALARGDEAALSYNRAEKAKAEFTAHYDQARLKRESRRTQEALASADAAVALGPYSSQAWNMRADLLLELSRFTEAEECLDRSLAIEPDGPEALYNRARAFQALKRYDEALADYDKVLAIRPDFAEAINNRGTTLWSQHRFREAADHFRQALALRPDFTEVLKNLGSVLFESGHTEEGMNVFARHAQQVHGHDGKSAETGTHSHKLKHDAEQLQYLAERDIVDAGAPATGKFRLADGSKLAGFVINQANGNGAIENGWRTNQPQIVVIDDFLTDDALEKLREFCRASTIWRSSYPDGYLGAMPEEGFACPLLAQIAEELRATFPVIFRDLPLCYLWGFKYDSSLNGIGIHADAASVNVNFWITPDEANLDPESGGLVVWDVAAPLDWNFQKFNADRTAMREFLARNNAKPVRIPYRSNRAVIFDSDLFHATDKIKFKDGYLNRRINITLLYGHRETK